MLRMLADAPVGAHRRPSWAALLTTFALALTATFALVGSAVAEESGAPAEAAEQPSTLQSEAPAPTLSGETTRSGIRAERRAARGGQCSVSLSTSQTVLATGQTVEFVGSVQCAETAEADAQTVTIYAHAAGGAGFAAIGTAVSAADGSFTFAGAPIESNTTFFAALQSSHSARVRIKVSASVTFNGPPAGTALPVRFRHANAAELARAATTFTGIVTPHEGGARVLLERESASVSERWRKIGSATVADDGSYSISHSFKRAGNVKLRVLVKSRGRYLRAASEPLSYVIASRQRPTVTIFASESPLVFGDSVTISGDAHPGEALQLLARTRTGAFASVASTDADSGGHYSFETQSPLQSVRYYVRGEHDRSAVLLVGVSPAIEAQMSEARLASEGIVTFSGTVAPDHSGDVIYLQREYPSGVGFATVQIATIGSKSMFSIEQLLAGSGSHVYRLLVPADRESLAATSAPFTVEPAQPPPTASASEPAA
ncbi:MAG TPA: hypothetical protein VH025_09410 [Solirubrobacteraceae bacterium]|jgi:hypothetical protein|nr:hypothetical protein [Solirubrobacteraceae bacterium]